MEPSRDLDDFGRVLALGDLNLVQMNLLLRVQDHLEAAGAINTDNEATKAAHAAAAKDLYALRWGPTQTPIYNLLGLFAQMMPSNRLEYHALARFFIDTAKVPVDATDLSGTTALSHCFSTKPCFDLAYAHILYDAGGDVNHRNRYGNTVAQEIVQVWNPSDAECAARAESAFEWFVTHGGNVDIADGDGMCVRPFAERGRVRGLRVALEKEEKRRRARGDQCCTFCGREDRKLLRCGRCRKAIYCEPGVGRACQKTDWPRHKKSCKV